MKELKIKKKSKLSEFFTDKGFYFSLMVSLTLLGFTIWFVMNKSIDKVIDNNINLMENSEFSKKSDSKSVNNVVSDVPIKEKKKFLSLAKNEDVKENSKSEEQNEDDENITDKNAQILFVAPLDGEVVSNFSNNELVKNKTLQDWRVHSGVDIKSVQGVPVKAIADGTISKIYEDPMWGTCIEIEHENNIVSLYCGLNKKVHVNEKDEVEAGSIIGSVGATSICEDEIGPHIHLEIKEDGIKIDPLTKVKIS